MDLGDETYDKVFAIHVAALHRPGSALDVVRERLAPGGRLYLFSQAPGWRTREPAERFAAKLGDVLDGAGFAVERVLIGDFGKAFAAGVVATRLRQPAAPPPALLQARQPWSSSTTFTSSSRESSASSKRSSGTRRVISRSSQAGSALASACAASS
jgi:hypothetical protein